MTRRHTVRRLPDGRWLCKACDFTAPASEAFPRHGGVLRVCLGCQKATADLIRGRCADCQQTTEQRGYGREHQQIRRDLSLTLPAPCGYCGVTITPGERWVAAHVVDGDPDSPRVVAHPGCNERGKGGRNLPNFGGSPTDRKSVV